jgi:hypothetical protein
LSSLACSDTWCDGQKLSQSLQPMAMVDSGWHSCPAILPQTKQAENSSSLPGVPYPCHKVQGNVLWTSTYPWLDRPWHFQDYLWLVHGILQAIHGWPDHFESSPLNSLSIRFWTTSPNAAHLPNSSATARMLRLVNMSSRFFDPYTLPLGRVSHISSIRTLPKKPVPEHQMTVQHHPWPLWGSGIHLASLSHVCVLLAQQHMVW